MDPIALLALAALAAAASVWLWRRRSRDSGGEDGGHAPRVEGIDTVAGWPPEVTRVLTAQERRAFRLLTIALPDHIVLAQVPVARFIRVPTRNSYHEWMRRVGQLCADLVVCDAASQVIAVVEVRRPAARESERARKRHERMDRVLRKAGVRVIEWNEELLPHRDAVREQIVPTPKASGDELGGTAGARGPAPGVAGSGMPSATRAPAFPTGAGGLSTAGTAATRVRRMAGATLDEALDEIEALDRSARRDGVSPAEPTPSTWFDELESDRMPLDRPKR
jgi:hypothetical protein